MKADIKATTTVIFAGIARRLIDAERLVFKRHQKAFLLAFTAGWKGWKYDGRPKSAKRNVSLRAWRSTIQTTEGAAVLRIFNEARDYRTGKRAYVTHVHRAGSAEIEWVKDWKEARASLLPPMIVDLRAEVAKNTAVIGSPKKLQPTGGGTGSRSTGLEV